MKFKLLSALAAITFAPLAAAQASIKIGFMAELSGPQGAPGQDQFDAFKIVVQANGGKLDGVAVEILKEDSQLRPEVAVRIVDKLIERDHVPIITGLTVSNVLMVEFKKVVDKAVLLIGSSAGPSPINAGNPAQG